MLQYLNDCAKEYYAGNPVISDAIYDNLCNMYHSSPNSPTVGARDGEFKHYKQMYSLNKTYDIKDVNESWIESPKLDGCAVSLLYINGVFKLGLTRGDGVTGRDITEKLQYLVPTTINDSGIRFITGEVVAFRALPNARNYASGALNLKYIEVFERERLHNLVFIAYGLENNKSDTYYNDMLFLDYQCFNTVLFSDNLDCYPTDGVVYRVNSNAEFDRLGYTATHPRGAIAFKEYDEADTYETILEDVIWQVGGNKVTPVAQFKEIDIDGAKVSRATLHNAGFVEALEFDIGDTIQVRRAGKIIPQVIGVVK